ncbi:hypothetical protein B0T24DRAFT_699510 [Lasiosphaeria ovina]|uniref:FAD-binding PCMH-type domain-containing protein n=1 Tax=Lasiosphaeria ovina TaxID=92902 RepID=A0AAE0KG94_9PEZI|nr:hypothetical protein B0T24DRAFT_699510 [Lasiosphaeria ovina]
MAPRILSVLAFAATATAFPGSGSNFNATALFGPHVSSGTLIAASSDPGFASVVGPRWSTWEAPTYLAAIKPATVSDIQQIVKIAGQHKIPFLATNAGHGAATGYGDVQNALNINLAHFNSVSIDVAKSRMTVGGGTKFGDVFDPLFAVGKELQTGNTWCVGVMGATLGGGIGAFQGLHGLVIDSLESVEMVTASGALVKASKTVNSDLFWALRGAGTNFGIVTKATFEVHDYTNSGRVILGQFSFPPAANVSVYSAVASFDHYIPPELALFVSATFNRTAGESRVNVAVIYFGPVANAQPFLDKFDALGPLVKVVRNLTTPDLFGNVLSTGVCNDGGRQNPYHVGLGRTDVPTFSKFFGEFDTFAKAHPSYAAVVVAQRYSNVVMGQTPDAATAYPWRDIKTYLLFSNTYTNNSIEGDVDIASKSWRSMFEATSGFSTPHMYVNYDHGDEGPAAKYGARKLAKLRALKQIWDPHHLFGTPNPLY